MNPIMVVKRTFPLKLSVKIILFIIGGTTIAGIVLYLLTQKISIAPSYAETISNIGIYKSILFKKSMLIYAIFTVLMLVGIIFISIIYSHRVAGPLQRVKTLSREMAEGKFDINVKFRKHDVIHHLSESINKMAEKYRIRDKKLKEGIKKLTEDAYALEISIKSGDKGLMDKAIQSLLLSAKDVDDVLSQLRL